MRAVLLILVLVGGALVGCTDLEHGSDGLTSKRPGPPAEPDPPSRAAAPQAAPSGAGPGEPGSLGCQPMMLLQTNWFPGLPADGVMTFLIFGSASAVIFGMGKVGFGGGVGILAVPIMVLATGSSELATGLMLPLLICADWYGFFTWRGQWDFHAFRQMLPGVAGGIALGGVGIWMFQHFGLADHGDRSELLMRLAIGVIALGFCGLHVGMSLSRRDWVFRPVFWQASVAGGLVGITSTLAHAAGPVATMFLISQNMDKKRFVATTVLLFLIVNHLKLVPYGALHLIRADTLLLGLWLAPAVLVGAVLGKLLNTRVPQAKFTGIIYILLAATGGYFVYKALLGLLAG